MRRTLGILPLLLLLLLLFGAASAPAGDALYGPSSEELAYSGATTISLCLLYGGAAGEFTKRTGYHFHSIEGRSGTGRGVEHLLSGKATLAGVARPLTDGEIRSGLVPHLIGYDTIAVWVNAGNPLKGLTLEQLKGLYSGRFSNWKQVGGEDLPVRLFMEPPESGRATPDILRRVLLGDTPFAPPQMVLEDARELLIKVSEERRGICAVSVGLAATLSTRFRSLLRPLPIDGVTPSNAPGKAPPFLLTRPLYLVTKGEPRGKVKAFVEFMKSHEGQGLIARYFIPAST